MSLAQGVEHVTIGYHDRLADEKARADDLESTRDRVVLDVIYERLLQITNRTNSVSETPKNGLVDHRVRAERRSIGKRRPERHDRKTSP